MNHPNHSELVQVAINAFMNCAPIATRVTEACKDDGLPVPTPQQIGDIMIEAHSAVH